METKTYTLKHPVPLPAKAGEAAGVQLSSITFRRPKAKDLVSIEKAAKIGFASAQVAIIAALGDISQEIAAELDAEDYEAAAEMADSFFPKAPKPSTDGASK